MLIIGSYGASRQYTVLLKSIDLKEVICIGCITHPRQASVSELALY